MEDEKRSTEYRIQAYLPERLHSMLQDICVMEGMGISEFVRDAIRDRYKQLDASGALDKFLAEKDC